MFWMAVNRQKWIWTAGRMFTGFRTLAVRRHQHTKSWQRFFEQIESDLFQNRIRRQRPVGDIRFVQYENIFAYYVLAARNRSLPLDDHRNTETLVEELQFDLAAKSSEKTIKAINEMDLKQISRFMIDLADKIPIVQKETDFFSIFLCPESPLAQIWRQLDSVLVQRLQKLWPEEREIFFQISRIWFELGLAQHTRYNGILVDQILEIPDPLDKDALLHLMFLLNLARFVPDREKESRIIAKTEQFIRLKSAVLNFYELSVIGAGFFKTQTRLPLDFLRRYIDLCTRELSGDPTIKSTIAVAAVLKVIRFSLETIKFNTRQLKQPVSLLVEALSHHPERFLDSEICLTHLVLMTNSAFLFDKNLYRYVFRRMMSDLTVFRIKDVERILFCLANARFLCPEADLVRLEQHLADGEECHLYPYIVYNIVFYLILIDYYPQKLIRICCQPQFLEKSLVATKLPLALPLLTLDTILRLRSSDQKLLNFHQIHRFREDIAHLFRNSGNRPSRKERFLKLIEDSLRPRFGPERFRMMYLFPFATSPYPVILNQGGNLTGNIHPKDRTLCPYPDSMPYQENHLGPKFFSNCLAILPVLEKDWTVGSNLRGYAHLNKCLLEQLGFKTVILEQNHFKECLATTRKPTPDQLKMCQKQIAAKVMDAMKNRHHHHIFNSNSTGGGRTGSSSS